MYSGEHFTNTIKRCSGRTKMETNELTGAIRKGTKGRTRPDLISPIFINKLGLHCAVGAEEHGERNWEKGLNLSRYIESAYRHLNQLREGLNNEDHAVAIAWNIMGFIHTKEMIKRGILPKELDDLPSYINKKEVKKLIKEQEILDNI